MYVCCKLKMASTLGIAFTEPAHGSIHRRTLPSFRNPVFTSHNACWVAYPTPIGFPHTLQDPLCRPSSHLRFEGRKIDMLQVGPRPLKLVEVPRRALAAGATPFWVSLKGHAPLTVRQQVRKDPPHKTEVPLLRPPRHRCTPRMCP